jgi:hypothetical protein
MHHSQQDFKKGLSMDIDKLDGFVSKVKSAKSPRWASRKMLVTVGLIGGLIWLFKGSLGTILWQITILAGLWLVCTTVTDVFEKHYQHKLKEKLIDEMTKNGQEDLTKEEADIINGIQ